MLAPLVALAALALAPDPAALVRADTLLRQPPGTDATPDPHPAFRRCLLAVMHREGACDPECFREWWPDQLPWISELDHARRVFARSLALPPLVPDRSPPRTVFARVAAEHRAYAAALRDRATRYREAGVWEPDREAWYAATAGDLERESERIGCRAGELEQWATAGWARPRRVVWAEVRAAGWE